MDTSKKIIDLIIDVVIANSGEGATCRAYRIPKVVSALQSVLRGNYLEIGVGGGQTATEVNKIIRDTIVLVDPWLDRYSDGQENGYKIEDFTNFDKMKEGTVLIRKTSQEAVKEITENAPYMFAFIDGDVFTEKNFVADLELAHSLNVPVICIDDYKQRNTTVGKWTDEWLARHTDIKLINGGDYGLHESYAVRTE